MPIRHTAARLIPSVSVIREIHHIGDDTPERIVRRSVCPAMAMRGIMTVGLSDAGRAYRMARPKPGYVHFVVCTGGRGRVWTGDTWADCATGMAYIAPPLTPHAFETVGRQRWQFCWIYYAVRPDTPPLITGDRPILLQCDPRPLNASIEGLYTESITSADVATMDQWTELVHTYALRLIGPYRGHDRLWRVWADINENLAYPWTLDDLADRAGVSAEQLRRLTAAHLGRSPMQQVTHLRMLRAAALLNSTPHKLQAIARAVGYENAFAFSTAFKRWSGGRSPQAYRTEAISMT